jgi:hypothetical protein
LQRREKLPALEGAYQASIVNDSGWLYAIAVQWGVDERELRDYIDFRDGVSHLATHPAEKVARAQTVLDEAYIIYCQSSEPFARCIKSAALAHGKPDVPRFFNEMWEVDPFFYPTGYTHE